MSTLKVFPVKTRETSRVPFPECPGCRFRGGSSPPSSTADFPKRYEPLITDNSSRGRKGGHLAERADDTGDGTGAVVAPRTLWVLRERRQGRRVDAAPVSAGSGDRYLCCVSSLTCWAICSSTALGSAEGATAFPMLRLMVLLAWSQDGSSTG